MKISVVMTTYNGSRYIKEQLDSIRLQSKAPDEVIIQDDVSDDSTCEIIDTYINRYKLKNWRLYRNEKNVGWKYNFFCALKKASGDIIFFSDQDDIWHSDKIKIMSSLFSAYKMDALYAEKRVIDEEGRLNTARMEKSSFSEKLKRISFSESYYTIKTLGCLMCISRKIADLYLRIGHPQGGHDSQCGRLALVYGSLWHLDKPLIDYRIHGANNSGISADASYGQSTLEKRLEELKNNIIWVNKVMKDFQVQDMLKVEPDRHKILHNSRCVMKYRYLYLVGSKNINILSLLRLRKYYPNLGMIFGDAAYKYKLNQKIGRIRWKIKKAAGI